MGTILTVPYLSRCLLAAVIWSHSAAAELEQALLHAWFVRSMPGTPELRATPVTCREAGREIAPVLPVPVVHCTVSVQLYSTENDWENDCARYGLMRHLLIFCPSSSSVRGGASPPACCSRSAESRVGALEVLFCHLYELARRAYRYVASESDCRQVQIPLQYGTLR